MGRRLPRRCMRARSPWRGGGGDPLAESRASPYSRRAGTPGLCAKGRMVSREGHRLVLRWKRAFCAGAAEGVNPCWPRCLRRTLRQGSAVCRDGCGVGPDGAERRPERTEAGTTGVERAERRPAGDEPPYSGCDRAPTRFIHVVAGQGTFTNTGSRAGWVGAGSLMPNRITNQTFCAASVNGDRQVLVLPAETN